MLRMQSYSHDSSHAVGNATNVTAGKAMRCGILIKLLQDSWIRRLQAQDLLWTA